MLISTCLDWLLQKNIQMKMIHVSRFIYII